MDAQRAKFGATAPVDLLTSSGSGLDPHISPEAAMLQIKRIAAARRCLTSSLPRWWNDTTEPPQLGFLGEPRVNVLRLNLLLDQGR